MVVLCTTTENGRGDWVMAKRFLFGVGATLLPVGFITKMVDQLELTLGTMLWGVWSIVIIAVS